MARECLPGLHLIQECGPDRTGFAESRNRHPVDWYEPGRAVHVPQNAYLLAGGEANLLLDTLSPAGREQLLGELGALLDGDGLDYLVVSHPDVPHAGNTLAVLRAHPECTLVAPAFGSTHELYHLDGALKVAPGDGLDLGDRRVRFHEAVFLDAPISLWMSEETSGTLFPVDWLGIPHLDGECGRTAGELALEPREWISRLVEFHGRVMFWYEYVDVERVHREIDRIADELAPRRLAPAHGAFTRDDPEPMLRWMKSVVEAVVERGRVGALG